MNIKDESPQTQRLLKQLRWVLLLVSIIFIVIGALTVKVEGSSVGIPILIVGLCALALLLYVGGKKFLTTLAVTSLIVGGGLLVGVRTEPEVKQASAHNVMETCPIPSFGYAWCLQFHNTMVAYWMLAYTRYYHCLVYSHIQGGPKVCPYPGPMP